MARRSTIRQRKKEHLALCATRDVEFQHKHTWFDCVELVHQAVPEIAPAEVEIGSRLLGRRLAALFIIGAITGGTPEAGRINRQLAAVAAEKGIGLALGSQRPMLEDATTEKSFQVREQAPDILLLGNIGISQAVSMSAAEMRNLIERVAADAINLHLNTAMEIFQKGGDRPPGNAWPTIRRLSKALGPRLVIKETGCGISRETATRLQRLGVRTIDVAGAGGASWVRVESLRRNKPLQDIREFAEWGIPTAASLLETQGLKVRVISSGGLRTGLDLAKSIALGADAGSAALPVWRALHRGGKQELCQWLDAIADGLRTAMALAGCRTLKELQRAPVVITGPLHEWASQRMPQRRTRARNK